MAVQICSNMPSCVLIVHRDRRRHEVEDSGRKIDEQVRVLVARSLFLKIDFTATQAITDAFIESALTHKSHS